MDGYIRVLLLFFFILWMLREEFRALGCRGGRTH